MRIPRFFHPRRISLVLLLVLGILGLGIGISPVHAASPAYARGGNSNGCGGSSCSLTFNSGTQGGLVVQGDLILVHVVCAFSATNSANTPTDSLGNTYTKIIHFGTSNNIEDLWSSFSNTGGVDTVTVSQNTCSPFAFSVDMYSFVVGIGNTNQNFGSSSAASGSDALSLSINAGDMIYETFMSVFSSCSSVNGSSGQTTRELYCFTGQNVEQLVEDRLYSTGGATVSTSGWFGATGSGGFQHIVIQLKGAGGTPSGITTNTACYGNCGNPAVTLANTNSTHTVNFNQSITLFYQFQANLNGQILNITTNMAKSYINGQSLTIGVYVIPSCPLGATPFASTCVGLLQKSTAITNPSKGMNTIINLAIPVATGQWVGIAVTGLFSGLDLNDTNAQVPMMQTSGSMPPSIAQSASFSTTAKVGLWAFLVGNIITGIPPPSTIGGNCSGLLDCIIPNWVFSLCTNQTPTCQNGSALLWAFMLAIFTSFFFLKGTANIMPGVKIPIGEIFLLAFLVWIFIMSGLQLLFVWVPLFFFFVISVVAGKHYGKFL